MEVLPSINCLDFECAIKKLHRLERFLLEDHFVHLDVADGRFTFHKSWGDPHMWPKIKPRLWLEAHLMVQDPHLVLGEWLKAGARRVIVHYETLGKNPEAMFRKLKAQCEGHNAELMLSTNPETPITALNPILREHASFQVLAVHPGPADQKFLVHTLLKVKFLRREVPNATIEVDGGVTRETAKLAKDAGADTVVSASYIWKHADPKIAYENLKAV